MARKKTKVKAAPRVKRGGKIVGPSFEGWETWTGAAFNRFRLNAHMFYYEEYKHSDLLNSFWIWMTDSGYSKEQIRQAKAAPGSKSISSSIAIACRLLEDGCPDYNEEHNKYWLAAPGTAGEIKPLTHYIKKEIDEAIQAGSLVVEETTKEETVKEKVSRPTIQERITEQAIAVCSEIDKWLDTSFDSNFDPKGFNLKPHLLKNKVTQAHARKIITFYQKEMEDYQDLANLPTATQIKKMSEQEQDYIEQLKEGYSHLVNKSTIKKILEAYQNIIDACNMIVDSAKATRKVRKPKQRSATKVIEKLKYKKQDDKYNLVSVNPVEIIGANELWVFNCKTRKLGKYIASNIDPKGLARNGSGLSVKGTTITDFDETQSIQKTLRKPPEQLKEFKTSGKVALRKFLEDINAVDTKLNGRINIDTVILKVN
jgi:hypothetical protein